MNTQTEFYLAAGVALVAIALLVRQAMRKKTTDPKDRHKDHHADMMLRLGQAWATPLMVTFSLGALISLGEPALIKFFGAFAPHSKGFTPDIIVDLAILAIATVGVIGMDLVLINNGIEIRNLKIRKQEVPWNLTWGTYGIAAVEAATFMYVAYQIDSPPDFRRDFLRAAVVWGFIAMRAFAFPAAGIRLATLAKLPISIRQIFENVLRASGDALETLLENPKDMLQSGNTEIPMLMNLIMTCEDGINAKDGKEQRKVVEKFLAHFAVSNTSTSSQNNTDGLVSRLGAEGVEAGDIKKLTSGSEGTFSGSDNATHTPENSQNTAVSNTANSGSNDSISDQQNEELRHDQFDALSNTEESSDRINGSTSRATVDQIAPLHALSNIWNEQKLATDLIDGARTPDSSIFMTRLNGREITSLFGVSDRTFTRRWEDSGGFGIAPRFDDGKDGKRFRLGDVLHMYETGVFDGLSNYFSTYISQEDLLPVANGNGHHEN